MSSFSPALIVKQISKHPFNLPLIDYFGFKQNLRNLFDHKKSKIPSKSREKWKIFHFERDFHYPLIYSQDGKIQNVVKICCSDKAHFLLNLLFYLCCFASISCISCPLLLSCSFFEIEWTFKEMKKGNPRWVVDHVKEIESYRSDNFTIYLIFWLSLKQEEQKEKRLWNIELEKSQSARWIIYLPKVRTHLSGLYWKLFERERTKFTLTHLIFFKLSLHFLWDETYRPKTKKGFFTFPQN